MAWRGPTLMVWLPYLCRTLYLPPEGAAVAAPLAQRGHFTLSQFTELPRGFSNPKEYFNEKEVKKIPRFGEKLNTIFSYNNSFFNYLSQNKSTLLLPWIENKFISLSIDRLNNTQYKIQGLNNSNKIYIDKFTPKHKFGTPIPMKGKNKFILCSSCNYSNKNIKNYRRRKRDSSKSLFDNILHSYRVGSSKNELRKSTSHSPNFNKNRDTLQSWREKGYYRKTLKNNVLEKNTSDFMVNPKNSFNKVGVVVNLKSETGLTNARSSSIDDWGQQLFQSTTKKTTTKPVSLFEPILAAMQEEIRRNISTSRSAAQSSSNDVGITIGERQDTQVRWSKTPAPSENHLTENPLIYENSIIINGKPSSVTTQMNIGPHQQLTDPMYTAKAQETQNTVTADPLQSLTPPVPHASKQVDCRQEPAFNYISPQCSSVLSSKYLDVTSNRGGKCLTLFIVNCYTLYIYD